MTKPAPSSELSPQIHRDWLSRWYQAFLPYPYIATTRFFRTRQEALDAFWRHEVRQPDNRPAVPWEKINA
jgi:hypothetical protein